MNFDLSKLLTEVRINNKSLLINIGFYFGWYNEIKSANININESTYNSILKLVGYNSSIFLYYNSEYNTMFFFTQSNINDDINFYKKIPNIHISNLERYFKINKMLKND